MRHSVPRTAAALAAAVLALSCSDGTGPDFERLVITSTSLANGVVGQPYAEGIDAEGGDGEYTWTRVEGRLPRGLSLDVEDLPDNDALLHGTPTGEDSTTFTVQVESGDGQVATQEFTVEVFPDPVQNVALAPALVGFPYEAVLRTSDDVTGGQWSLVQGSLPPGLTLAGDRITGTPTATDTVDLTLRFASDQVTVERTFKLVVVADRPDDYHITAFEVVEVTDEIRPHLDDAIAKWERVLASDLEVGTIPAGQFPAQVCSGYGADLNGTAIDDLLLIVNIESIDGPGDVLAQAGPCLFREDTIPAAGILTMDLDDLEPLVGSPTLTYIISHEIGHVLGFGGLWDLFGLVTGADTQDPRFTGPLAVAEWQALGGGGSVPVEAEGGEGTSLAHWRESTFDSERMTGFSEANRVPQPLSRVSVAAMADLGYDVDYTAADPFTLPAALRADGSVANAFAGTLGYDVLYDGPVGMLGRDGRGRIMDLR